MNLRLLLLVPVVVGLAACAAPAVPAAPPTTVHVTSTTTADPVTQIQMVTADPVTETVTADAVPGSSPACTAAIKAANDVSTQLLDVIGQQNKATAALAHGDMETATVLLNGVTAHMNTMNAADIPALFALERSC